MKFIASLLVVFLLNFNLSAQSTCSCTATTKKNKQQRSGAKHEENYDDYVKKMDTVTVAYLNKWQRKYTAKTNTIKTTPSNPASKRKHGTPEDSVYVLKGYMWFVKVEGNDCDFHIEIGPENKFGNRIVVEVPRENLDLQKKIKEKLDELELKIMNCGTTGNKVAHFDTPIQVVVTGLGFYDASHKPNTNHGDMHTKKYSWELHPVMDIEFIEL
jgi:hypothetical protein